ncbi:17032_t:CDS:2 [Funneliformis geosporum]|uniref:17032_t:CDS:1 n=1 Tax=Funneliformis geosporum TaxID=1117311 RepID=A0A9W4SZE1_9GLOM|nr:17032_t:CDS:2 [Funneliformis geosporum]
MKLENFKQITEEYGQFIPIEVILDRRVYYERHKVLKEYSEVKANEGSTNISGGPIENRIGIDSTISKGKSNSYQHYLIIHRIQKNFKERKCKLKIGWMVIGYDTNLDFLLTDFNVQLKIIENDFNPSSNTKFKYYRELLNIDRNLLDRNASCIGILMLKTLDSSNNSLIIGQ